MDRKMRKEVSRPIRKAEGILHKAEKSNEKLANYDERVRDPAMKKLAKLEKKKHGRD